MKGLSELRIILFTGILCLVPFSSFSFFFLFIFSDIEIFDVTLRLVMFPKQQ